MPPNLDDVPSLTDEGTAFDLIAHGHRDLVQAVAFNVYGDRFATGSVDGKIRVFNRHKDGTWRLCDNWGAHPGEVLEVSFFCFVSFFARERQFRLLGEGGQIACERLLSGANIANPWLSCV